jgi:hypothetical protein
MPKLLQIMMYIFIPIAILFGLFMFLATRDVPLPNSANKVGKLILIDISEGAKDAKERQESLFLVPERFKPSVFEGGFSFYFKFPDESPYTGNETPIPSDRIRVVVQHHTIIDAARSIYVLKNPQLKGGTRNAPYFVEKKDGMAIYKHQYAKEASAVSTYYSFAASDGNQVLVEDPYDWSRSYQVDRKISPHIELTYFVSKPLVRDRKHFIEDVTAIEKLVLKLVQSFQGKS